MDSTVMHINDFPRPNSTLTRPLCILMILLDLTRHFISMEEDTVLVCRNAFYLDSLNINDLPRHLIHISMEEDTY